MISRISKRFVTSRGMEVDFDLEKIYKMPNIEQLIFFHVNFDKCRKEILKYEEARSRTGAATRHPKESKKEAFDVLRCHSKNLEFEPVCLDAFNDARECLFKLDGHMRLCINELNLFEECVHDPVRFDKFQRIATPYQATPKDYFSTVQRKEYFN